ncbi:MAG: helix-turn-helix domain-containing protein [Acidihalobacter sp.]|uniref:helix-turn-helix transcriptional regulator n=1 Tax=Acidihalobacter sp. TaxID=1872108 RepID=UPI00307FC2D0
MLNISNAIVRRIDAAQYLGISLPTLHRLVQRGELQAPIKLTRTASGWRQTELDEFIERRRRANCSTLQGNTGQR